MFPSMAPTETQQDPQGQLQGQSQTVLSTVGGEQKPEDPILQALKGPVGRIVREDVRLAIDPEKIVRYAEIRRNELYWRGEQYLNEVYNNNGQLVDFKPIDGTYHESKDDSDNNPMYSAVVNDIRGYGRKFIAVLAQEPPNVKVEPDDDQNEDHVRKAKKAQRVADSLHNLWDVKKQNRKLFLTYYKNGVAFGYTRFVADGEKYGYTEEPIMENKLTPIGLPMMSCKFCGQQTPVDNPDQPPQMCPQCGNQFGPEDMQDPEMAMIPQQTGTKQYANGCVEHVVESELRVTTNYDVEQLLDCPFLLREREVHKGRIFAQFPELKDKFKNEGGEAYGGGGTATTSGQLTRDVATSPLGTYIAPRKNRLMFSECWLRPIMYELAIDDVIINGTKMSLRDALVKLYPTGLKVTLVSGDYIAKLEEEKMDDVWAMSPPESAENAYPDALCKDYLDVQDFTNDITNIQRQTYERQIPQIFIDTRRIDTTYQAKYRQLPASFIPIQSGQGGNINDAIGHVPVAKLEPEMDQYATKEREHGAEIIGITPQIYGGGAAEQTAYATNLKRNQAMLQLSVPADAGRQYWVDVTTNGIKLMAKFSKGRVPSPYSPSQSADQVEDIEELLQGGWHVEPGDAMPMSWPEQREQLNENLKNMAGNPNLLGQLGFMLPSNIPALQDKLIGIPNWDIPNQNALTKLHGEIRDLLKSVPTQQPSQQTPGQMISVPTLPVDEFDDHGFVASALEEWFQTENAQTIRKSNPDGFQNVVAFWRSHKGLSMPPPMPMGGPGPSGGGPPLSGQSGPPGGAPGPGGMGHKLSPPPGGQAAKGAT